MTDLPYVAIGNDQLGDNLPPTITCSHCRQQHLIQCSSEDTANAGNSVTLQFYKCGEKTYLAGINRQEILP